MKNKRILKLVTLTVASCLPFIFSLQGDFVFDDTEAIINNKDVTSDNWIEIFYNDFWGTNIKSSLSHKSYRPLTILTFKLNYVLNYSTLSSTQYKITNLACHVFCCILVWTCFEGFVTDEKMRVGGSRNIDIPFLASLLFAVHPIHTEAICGIVGRADLLAGVTFYLAIIFYQKARYAKNTSTFLFMTVTSALISLLFKENGVTVLGVCIIYDLICCIEQMQKYQDDNNHRFSIKLDKNIGKRLFVIVIAIIILLYGRWKVMGESKPEFKPNNNPAAFAKNFFVRVATFNYIYSLNLLLLLWPQWLCYDWSMGCITLIEKVLDVRLCAVLLIYSYALFFLWALIRNRNKIFDKRLMLLAVSLVIVPFIPASNIFYYVGFVVAERVMYISSAGYCLLIVLGLNKIISKIQYRNNKGKSPNCNHRYISRLTSLILFLFITHGCVLISMIFFFILVVIYSLKSWKRSFDWQNEYQLYLSGLSICPLNAKIHYNVAKVAHETEFALMEYNEALRLYPEYYQAMNNLANVLRSEKKYDEAENLLRNAIHLQRDFPAAWMNLGIVLASTKRYSEALDAYKTALQYRKKYPDCLYNLGNLYLEMSKSQDALEHWTQATHYNSKHVLSWTNLLALLDNSGNLKKALEIIPKALEELPNAPSVLFSIANIYGKLDRFEDAEEYFMKAIQLFGPQVQAIHYSNLGVLYHRWKKYQQAKEIYIKALNIDPSFKSAIKNLKLLEKV